MSPVCVVHTNETQVTAALPTEEERGGPKVMLSVSEVLHVYQHTHWFHLTLKISTSCMSNTIKLEWGLVKQPLCIMKLREASNPLFLAVQLISQRSWPYLTIYRNMMMIHVWLLQSYVVVFVFLPVCLLIWDETLKKNPYNIFQISLFNTYSVYIYFI